MQIKCKCHMQIRVKQFIIGLSVFRVQGIMTQHPECHHLQGPAPIKPTVMDLILTTAGPSSDLLSKNIQHNMHGPDHCTWTRSKSNLRNLSSIQVLARNHCPRMAPTAEGNSTTLAQALGGPSN